MTKATHKKTRVDIMKSQKRQQKKAYGLGRQNLTGYTDVSGGFTTMHQTSTANSGGANSSSFLKISGGTMIGPLAFWQGLELIYPTSGNNNTLNLSPTEGAYTSHWVWAASGSKELEIITNNDPDTAFSGQILFIESVDTETPKIVDRSNTSGGTTGNIKTLDGEDFTFPSNKTIVLFMFSSIDNLWHQISNPLGGASTTLNNLGTTSINADLIPDGSQNLGSAADPWFNAHITNLIMEGTTHSGSGMVADRMIRVYIDYEGGYRYLQYYN
jgi:hypothetical protein